MEQLSSSMDGNAFDPRNTKEFDASLEATLTLKNVVKRNEEYTYSIVLMDSSARVVEKHAVSINVVGKWGCFMSCFDTLCLISVCVKCEVFIWNLTGFIFSVEKSHNAHRNSNYQYTVFRLSTVALLAPRVSCYILTAISRAILLCSSSNAGILINWSLSYVLVFCCFNLFLW